MSVRVRMAPSPTGLLHIGGVRTFLFNWLFARGHGGECLLRIENTDTSREVAEATAQIERSLRWLGIEWDGPTRFQLDGADRCHAEAARLVAESKAYDDDGAIRVRMPRAGVISWEDAVKGRIEFPAEELEDWVLVRSDGRPTSSWACVMSRACAGSSRCEFTCPISRYTRLASLPPPTAHSLRSRSFAPSTTTSPSPIARAQRPVWRSTSASRCSL